MHQIRCAAKKGTARIGILFAAFLLFHAHGHAATVIGPAEFEQIWLLNNQRNVIARYHQRTERFRRDLRPLWLMDIDSSTNQTIRTSAGDTEAIMDRIGIHYQDPNYLVLIDWLSLIPQPQTTEGFTYGDTVLGRSWQRGEKLGFTLGGRLQTKPKSMQSGGQAVFNLTNNASSDSLGGFAHLNYGDWDLGSYYSRQDGNQANALQFIIVDSDTRGLSSTLAYLRGAPDRKIATRYELALNHREQISLHEVRGGITVSLSGAKKTAVSNAYLIYHSPDAPGFRYSAGLFHTYLTDTNESLTGARLGMEYRFELDSEVGLGLFVRKNAFGDIDAMVVKNEPVFSFTLHARGF